MTPPINFDALYQISTLPRFFFDYVDSTIDTGFIKEIRFIENEMRELELCPLCYLPVTNGQPHGSWCK